MQAKPLGNANGKRCADCRFGGTVSNFQHNLYPSFLFKGKEAENAGFFTLHRNIDQRRLAVFE